MVYLVTHQCIGKIIINIIIILVFYQFTRIKFGIKFFGISISKTKCCDKHTAIVCSVKMVS